MASGHQHPSNTPSVSSSPSQTDTSNEQSGWFMPSLQTYCTLSHLPHWASQMELPIDLSGLVNHCDVSELVSLKGKSVRKLTFFCLSKHFKKSFCIAIKSLTLWQICLGDQGTVVRTYLFIWVRLQANLLNTKRVQINNTNQREGKNKWITTQLNTNQPIEHVHKQKAIKLQSDPIIMIREDPLQCIGVIMNFYTNVRCKGWRLWCHWMIWRGTF